MDSRDPHHHLQPPPPPMNVVLVGPNPFVPSTMMAPATARFPPFNINANPPPPPPPPEPNNNNDVSADAALKPCGEGSSFGSMKKKRGRPRKYFGDGNIALGLGSGSGSGSGNGSGSGPVQMTLAVTSPSSSTGKKKGRGRPRGSGKKQKFEVIGGVTGTSISPRVITVNHGEDIVAKVTAECQGGPNIVMHVISAHGLVSSVALHQPERIVTYEGQFEIINLSVKSEPSENNSGCRRLTSWKVAVAGPDSRLLGGLVADKLIAGSPVQVIMGGFTLDDKKPSSNNLKSGPSSTPSPHLAASGTPTSPTSQGPSSESSGDNENSPYSQGPGNYNNAGQPVPNMAMYHQLWDRQNQQ